MARVFLGTALFAAFWAAWLAWDDAEWRRAAATDIIPANSTVTFGNMSRIHTLYIPPNEDLQIKIPVTVYLQDGTNWTYPAPHSAWRKNP